MSPRFFSSDDQRPHFGENSDLALIFNWVESGFKKVGTGGRFSAIFPSKMKGFFPNREYSRVFLPSAIYPKLLFNWGGSLWICKSRLYGKMWMETYPTITTEKYVITEGVKNSLTRWFFLVRFLISNFFLCTQTKLLDWKAFFFNILICTRVWTKNLRQTFVMRTPLKILHYICNLFTCWLSPKYIQRHW